MALTIIEILQSTAVVTTILQFLSGTLISKNYIQKKSTGESSGFPFLCGFLSCSFWLCYGYLTNQESLVFVNFIGATLFFIYTLVYYVFTVNKRMYLKQFGLILTTLIAVCYYTSQLQSDEEAIRLMGMVCCVVTVCFFAAPLTMLFHVVRVKNSESLPLPLIVSSFLVSLQWLIYGIIISDTFIQIPNFLGCLLSILQLFLFVIYPPKSFNGHSYKLVDQIATY